MTEKSSSDMDTFAATITYSPKGGGVQKKDISLAATTLTEAKTELMNEVSKLRAAGVRSKITAQVLALDPAAGTYEIADALEFPSWGGARAGAGRHLKKERRVSVCLRLLPATKERLQSLRKEGYDVNQLIDDAVEVAALDLLDES